MLTRIYQAPLSRVAQRDSTLCPLRWQVNRELRRSLRDRQANERRRVTKHRYLITLRFLDCHRINLQTYPVMDLIRHSFRDHGFTASPYRIMHAYRIFADSNLLIHFFLTTIAYEIMTDAKLGGSDDSGTPAYVRDSLRRIMTKRPALDLVDAMADLVRTGIQDARRGNDCDWHIHMRTEKCGETHDETAEAPYACDMPFSSPRGSLLPWRAEDPNQIPCVNGVQ